MTYIFTKLQYIGQPYTFILSCFLKKCLLSVVVVIFICCCCIQLIYWLVFLFFAHTCSTSESHRTELSFPKICVIICAKNAENTLAACLDSILRQDYPTFNIIVVNDFSIDSTQDIIDEYQSKYDKIMSFFPSRDVIGKKLALSQAISKASNWALLTDADCTVMSTQWIRKISKKMGDDIDLVLGYGSFSRNRGLLNKLVRYETIYIALQYFTAARLGIPYMGVGRNLAVRKRAFEKIKQKFLSSATPFGDDDAIVKLIGSSSITAIATSKCSHTTSPSPNNFSNYFSQKRRHVQPSLHYALLHKVLLGLLSSSAIGFYVLGIGLIFSCWWITVVAALFIRSSLIGLTLIRSPFANSEKDILISFVGLDLFLMISYVVQFLFLPWRKSNW